MAVSGKVAIVTGAAQGLGKAFTESLLKAGAKVCFCDINEKQGQETLGELKGKYGGERVMFKKCDVTKHGEMEDVFKFSKETFGGLDIVCNNAGKPGEIYPLWEESVDVNLKGVIRGTLLALEYLRTDKGGNGGVIVNNASAAGLAVNPFGPVYCGAKAGVIAFTRSLACNPQIVSAGVRLNVLCPGFADTAIVSGISPENCYDVEKARMFVNSSGLMTPEEVSEYFMELVEDETKQGAVLKCTKQAGKQYCKLTVEFT